MTELCLPVFPCSDGVSTNTKIKAPLVQGGFQSATGILARLRPGGGASFAAIGVPTGMVSGIVALDIDVRPNKDGEVSLLNAGVELTNLGKFEHRLAAGMFSFVVQKSQSKIVLATCLARASISAVMAATLSFAGALLLTDSTNPSPGLIPGPRILRSFQKSFGSIASKFQIPELTNMTGYYLKASEMLALA